MGFLSSLVDFLSQSEDNFKNQLERSIKQNPNLTKEQKDSKLDSLNKTSFSRRTDEDAAGKPLDWPRDSASSCDVHSGSLREAAYTKNCSGVYILKLDGEIMKVGSAEIGVSKRMSQYYNLNSACGLNQYINDKNRDSIYVVWQDCPKSKCNELESKLFRKHGKGPWAKRSPHSSNNTWTLLI